LSWFPFIYLFIGESVIVGYDMCCSSYMLLTPIGEQMFDFYITLFHN